MERLSVYMHVHISYRKKSGLIISYYRYPPHGTRADARECGIPWERIRAPPVDTSPHDLHISDCSNDLHPGDHIEIQWRRNKEFPYGLFLSPFFRPANYFG